jgi:hypothetical protein
MLLVSQARRHLFVTPCSTLMSFLHKLQDAPPIYKFAQRFSLVFRGVGLLEKVLDSRYLSAETASGENRQEEVCTALVNLPDILCNELYINKQFSSQVLTFDWIRIQRVPWIQIRNIAHKNT